jgi:hypothetical protein
MLSTVSSRPSAVRTIEPIARSSPGRGVDHLMVWLCRSSMSVITQDPLPKQSGVAIILPQDCVIHVAT